MYDMRMIGKLAIERGFGGLGRCYRLALDHPLRFAASAQSAFYRVYPKMGALPQNALYTYDTLTNTYPP